MANQGDPTLFISVEALVGSKNEPINTTGLELIARFATGKTPEQLQPALLAAVQAGLSKQVEFYVKEKHVDINADYYADLKPQKLLYIAWRNRHIIPNMYDQLLKLEAKMSEQDLLATGDLEFTDHYKAHNKSFLPPKPTRPKNA